jgi:dihydrofolate reductase
MRKIIAAFRVSVDGFIEAADGNQDWVDSWEDIFEITPQIDTCILGGGMYPGYEGYWSAVLANANSILPFTGKAPVADEISYAHFAAKTPHIVHSTKLKEVKWKNTRIVRNVEEMRNLKEQPGKDIYAVGGPTFVSSLINLRLIDELRLLINPIILGGGKALFKDVTERQLLKLMDAKPFQTGVKLIYEM